MLARLVECGDERNSYALASEGGRVGLRSMLARRWAPRSRSRPSNYGWSHVMDMLRFRLSQVGLTSAEFMRKAWRSGSKSTGRQTQEHASVGEAPCGHEQAKDFCTGVVVRF